MDRGRREDLGASGSAFRKKKASSVDRPPEQSTSNDPSKQNSEMKALREKLVNLEGEVNTLAKNKRASDSIALPSSLGGTKTEFPLLTRTEKEVIRLGEEVNELKGALSQAMLTIRRLEDRVGQLEAERTEDYDASAKQQIKREVVGEIMEGINTKFEDLKTLLTAKAAASGRMQSLSEAKSSRILDEPSAPRESPGDWRALVFSTIREENARLESRFEDRLRLLQEGSDMKENKIISVLIQEIRHLKGLISSRERPPPRNPFETLSDNEDTLFTFSKEEKAIPNAQNKNVSGSFGKKPAVNTNKVKALMEQLHSKLAQREEKLRQLKEDDRYSNSSMELKGDLSSSSFNN
eukprot:TRINITY_DN5069_c0_g1_i4.p1 TRINITY_DN5069_c0_g1~~TRINITY_DN5069_c0_g1_i4.p1  ORF type:complete len:351 (+),score=84.17 TRINITY_DN5069_c0_g1_i4:727-1779(+)